MHHPSPVEKQLLHSYMVSLSGMCQGLFKEARKMSAQTLNKCSGERCFCGTVTGIFSSANLCLCSGDLDVASCNNRHNCLISCAEILIGTGLKYAQCL